MGRKRREGPGVLAMLVLLLFLTVALRSAQGEREVGCLFNKNLCNPETEVCYVDWAFGRCILIEDHLAKKDLYQYNLEPEELELLRMQLERLEYEGYKWPHDYTQCVMQIMLDDLRYRTNNDVEELCKGLKMRDETISNDENQVIDTTGIKTVVEEEPEAIVRFSPSKINPHGEFADEFYYPALAGGPQRYEENHLDDYDESFYDKLGAIGDRQEVLYRRGSRSLSSTGPIDGIGDNSQLQNYPKDKYTFPQEYVQEALRGYLEKEATNIYGGEAGDDGLEFLPSSPTNVRIPWLGDNRPGYETGFARKYKFPKELDGLDLLDSRDEAMSNEDDYVEETKTQSSQPVRQRPLEYASLPHSVDQFKNLPLDEELKNMLLRREMAGFKRRERLDVKKPGPPFSTNNYAFKTQSPPTVNDKNIEETVNKNAIETPVENTVEKNVMHLPQIKKEINNPKLSSSPKIYENVDLDHVYIQFSQEFHSWSEGERVVNLVGSLLKLQPGELKEIRVGRAEVTFKVPKNSREYNAVDVVNRIDNIRKDLQKELKVEVVRAGIGDKAKLPAILDVRKTASVGSAEMSSSLFGALVAAGVAGVSTAAVVVLLIARRHAKSRAKLAGLRTPDPEASKDYQELCRARMQAKQADKLTESPKGFDFGRLIETGKSEHESNRSSTSSWCDSEPQLTNMDVATGHLLLSYMEEHLKNQEKLDEEWAAICAYEAEPCSTAVAEAEGNSECNRSGAALPYDHSRVILNDLANLNNSDYINASTITDHDPRNPAYIATQGPLPQTAADFWQLVWEQGSVVIVMLTRLAEDGETMCHRYWPEEGSELYHIYEVHIVSEHVWCDDYLVRSFYLKNLRTGETRTLTQFHFLTWARDSVPSSTKTLLEFRRKVNKSYRGRSCPIIIHCSDGAARTGTYCLIDMVLNRMAKGAKEIDIAATLEHIRDQRSGMVATKEQFEFVLMAVAEEVHTILKSLPIVADGSTKNTDTPPSNKSDK